jgi:hypothetical protein
MRWPYAHRRMVSHRSAKYQLLRFVHQTAILRNFMLFRRRAQ